MVFLVQSDSPSCNLVDRRLSVRNDWMTNHHPVCVAGRLNRHDWMVNLHPVCVAGRLRKEEMESGYSSFVDDAARLVGIVLRN